MQQMPLHVVFVEVWIKKWDKFLLARRSQKDDQAAWKWSTPGWKVEMEVEKNIVENTIKREVMEEVWIEIENIEYLSSRAFIRSSWHHVIGLSFLCDYKSWEAKPLEDHDEIKWANIDEMKTMLDEYYWEVINLLSTKI